MSETNGTWVQQTREVLEMIERYGSHPHGPEATPETVRVVGTACILLAGDNDRARSLWKEIVHELGYMPQAAAVALIRASRARELMPDVQVPEVGG